MTSKARKYALRQAPVPGTIRPQKIGIKADCGVQSFLKSEVAIVPLFHQIQQTKKFLLQVKTITKLPRNGIAESVKSCNLHQKGSFKA